MCMMNPNHFNPVWFLAPLLGFVAAVSLQLWTEAHGKLWKNVTEILKTVHITQMIGEGIIPESVWAQGSSNSGGL